MYFLTPHPSAHPPSARVLQHAWLGIALALASPAIGSDAPKIQACPALWMFEVRIDGDSNPRPLSLCANTQAVFDHLPPHPFHDATVKGPILRLDFRASMDRIELSLSKAEAGGADWGTLTLEDGETHRLVPEDASGPGATVEARREVPREPHVRLDGVASTHAWLAGIAEATGLELVGRDLVPDGRLQYGFTAIPVINALQAMTWDDESLELWRLGDHGFRFVKVRDHAQLEALREQLSAATRSRDYVSMTATLDAIRLLGRLRGPDDRPPDVEVDTEWHAHRLEQDGQLAEAVEVRREMLARAVLRDPRQDAPLPAEQRAALAWLLFELGQREEAAALLAAARPVLDAATGAFSEPRNLGRYGHALWRNGDVDAADSVLRRVLAAADAEGANTLDGYHRSDRAHAALMAIAYAKADAQALEALARDWAVRAPARSNRHWEDGSYWGAALPGPWDLPDEAACVDLMTQLWRIRAIDSLPGGAELGMLMECALVQGDFAAASALTRFMLAIGEVGPKGGRMQEQLRHDGEFLDAIARSGPAAAGNALAEHIVDPVHWPQAAREGIDRPYPMTLISTHDSITQKLRRQGTLREAHPEDWLNRNDALAVLELRGGSLVGERPDPAQARARFAESQALHSELGMDAEAIRAREAWFEALATAATEPADRPRRSGRR